MPIEVTASDSPITVSASGTKIDAAVSGGQGPAGPAATITVGTVTTGAPGSSASVVNAGTTSAAVLNFTIPAGATGATGPAGPQGPAGAAGASSWDDITGKPSTFAPSAHAASHAAGGADQLFDQVLSTTNSPTFAGLQLNGGLLSTGSANFQTPTGGLGSGFVINPTTGALTWPDGTTQNTAGSAASHAHGSITSAGAIGTTSGLIVTTGASGVLGTLAMGTAGQVLKVNSGATGVEWGAAAADVSIDTTAADILSASSGSITADDAGSDKLVFWDDSAGKLTYLSAGTNITITDTTISAAGSTSASDLTSGTLGFQRLPSRVRSATSLYLWSSFR